MYLFCLSLVCIVNKYEQHSSSTQPGPDVHTSVETNYTTGSFYDETENTKGKSKDVLSYENITSNSSGSVKSNETPQSLTYTEVNTNKIGAQKKGKEKGKAKHNEGMQNKGEGPVIAGDYTSV
jgi:hypothetical protein